jgi:signal transduction histidine kinase
MNILVIEDEQPLREEIVDMLQFEGFRTLEADDGEIGLKLAFSHSPDLVLCDIAMSKTNGYEVLEHLRENPRTSSLPFIFLTARADRSFMRHGMELGADDYLTKPFTRAELLAAIHARVERHQVLADSHAQQFEEAKTTLTHLVAHELRTPLASILMVQEVIARQVGQLTSRQTQELLDILNTGSKRLSHLVEQMVYITELETGALSPNQLAEVGQIIQLWQILPAAIDLGRQFAFRNRDDSIRFQERDPKATVLANLPALKHALAELIANALNFSPEGSEITLSGWQAEGIAWITILDQGSGIPSDQLERIFDAFYQIDRALQEQQGIGLGLPLARRIIEVHGGKLTLNSMISRGTQVTVGLPLA